MDQNALSTSKLALNNHNFVDIILTFSKVCKSMHHRTIQINYQTDAALFQFIILTFVYSRPARPRTQHDYHHDTKVKPKAATAVIELLMMGGKAPETC
jgi:hypothetical protein